jgi:ribosomal protein L32
MKRKYRDDESVTDKTSRTFAWCKNCGVRKVRNYVYSYCPDCMNDFYHSRELLNLRLPMIEWVKSKDGLMVGRNHSC